MWLLGALSLLITTLLLLLALFFLDRVPEVRRSLRVESESEGQGCGGSVRAGLRKELGAVAQELGAG